MNINKKDFISSVLILLALMIIAVILTNIIPTGRYEIELVEGRVVINPYSIRFTNESSYPIWRWLTAPFEVLWSNDAPIVIPLVDLIGINR